jgi:ABC-type branched-subunit amino acid transport system substrate-binding protein
VNIRIHARRWTSVAAVATAAFALAACGGAGSTNASSASVSGTANAAPSSSCGEGTGQQATGEPIKLGAVVTTIPGLSFTDATGMVKAYFDCVNDNGGVHGRPLEYVVKEDALDPQLTASQATYLLDSGAKKLVIFTSNTPGSDAINESVTLLAQQAGVPVEAWLENVPVNDAYALALRAVQSAGDGGGVVVNVNPGEAIKVFKAVQQQGLLDQVKWGCPAGCNDASFAKQLGGAWDGKLGIDAEMNIVGSGGPDDQLYRTVQAKYGPQTAVGNFGQLGFTAARIATTALLKMPAGGDVTVSTVSAAFQGLTDYTSDLYCKQWYFGTQGFHAANNSTRIVTPSNGGFEQVRGCQEIPALPNNKFADIRTYEKTLGIG